MRNLPNRSAVTRFVVIITTTLVSFIGLATLFGLVFGDMLFAIPDAVPGIGGTSGAMPTGLIARVFVRLAVVTLSFSIIVGIFNLIMVNVQRAAHGPTFSAKINSAVVLTMFLLGILAPIVNPELGEYLLQDVQTTLESSLAALIFFALVYGAFRILKRKVTASAILFVLTVEIVLIGALPVAAFEPVRRFADWLFNVPVNAGARGILLGIALATLITGLRVLIGQDRTYGE